MIFIKIAFDFPFITVANVLNSIQLDFTFVCWSAINAKG